jgi:hypothetical protein
LHDHLPRVIAVLRNAISGDAVFESVVAAAGGIGLLWESREPLEARDVEELPSVLLAAYERALYLGAGSRSLQGDGMALVSALSQLRELLVSEAGRHLDGSLYWQMIVDLHLQHPAAVVRGACAGLMYLAGHLSSDDLGMALEGHLSGLRDPGDAVGYLRGLLSTAREAAWQQQALLGVLDRLLQHWDESEFVAALPELRLAFAGMTPKETDRVAESVAGLHGATHLDHLVVHTTSESEVQTNLALSVLLRETLEADGLKAWLS